MDNIAKGVTCKTFFLCIRERTTLKINTTLKFTAIYVNIYFKINQLNNVVNNKTEYFNKYDTKGAYKLTYNSGGNFRKNERIHILRQYLIPI